MGSNHHQPVDVDPQALANAKSSWHVFTESAKYTIVAVTVLLLLMAAFLV